jgi:hypothetical protein
MKITTTGRITIELEKQRGKVFGRLVQDKYGKYYLPEISTQRLKMTGKNAAQAEEIAEALNHASAFLQALSSHMNSGTEE